MKINLPIFKDEDAKDAVTYQSWRWDLTVYRHAGCRDCTLLPYAIRSLQGYPGELVWSSGTDITLDDVLTILDADDGEYLESDDPDGIEGVTEELMVLLARAVKDAQADERHCYHCSSPEHFICNCLLMKTARDKKQLNRKEGMVMVKGAQTPPKAANAIKSPQKEAQEA